MSNWTSTERWAAVGIGAIVVLSIVGIWFQAAMESKTYNKLTGAHTTTWDALWVELRVQGQTEGN